MTVQKPSRLINLDILRLVSACLVLGFHYGFRMQISGEGGGIGFPELAPLAMWFDTGLLIFFAISGYVIALSAENRTAYQFAAGRVARLWPTFVVCATVTAIVLSVWPLPGMTPPTIRQWLAHAVIISRGLGEPFLDGAYWTIAYEIIFYVWVFLLIMTGQFQRNWRAAVLVWLLISVANELLIDSGGLRKVLITEYSGYFAFGLVLYKTRQQASAGNGCVLAAAAAWAVAAPFLIEASFVEMYGVSRSPAGLMLIGPVALAAVTISATARSIAISPALAVALGGLTYPLYLLHQNIGYAIFARFGTEGNRWFVALCLISVLLLVSFGVARFVEPPARRLIVGGSVRLADNLRQLRRRAV